MASAPLSGGQLPIIDVAAGLIFRRGELLITQRRAHDHLGGLWEFPGGKREASESFEECLARELKEELGIVVQVIDLVGTVTHHYPEKSVHLRFFKCRLLEAEPRALACEALAWVRSSQLTQYAFPDADAQLLQKLISTPELWKD
jgi:8-oxo-dGTP diphosphatase